MNTILNNKFAMYMMRNALQNLKEVKKEQNSLIDFKFLKLSNMLKTVKKIKDA